MDDGRIYYKNIITMIVNQLPILLTYQIEKLNDNNDFYLSLKLNFKNGEKVGDKPWSSLTASPEIVALAPIVPRDISNSLYYHSKEVYEQICELCWRDSQNQDEYEPILNARIEKEWRNYAVEVKIEATPATGSWYLDFSIDGDKPFTFYEVPNSMIEKIKKGGKETIEQYCWKILNDLDLKELECAPVMKPR